MELHDLLAEDPVERAAVEAALRPQTRVERWLGVRARFQLELALACDLDRAAGAGRACRREAIDDQPLRELEGTSDRVVWPFYVRGTTKARGAWRRRNEIAAGLAATAPAEARR